MCLKSKLKTIILDCLLISCLSFVLCVYSGFHMFLCHYFHFISGLSLNLFICSLIHSHKLIFKMFKSM